MDASIGVDRNASVFFADQFARDESAELSKIDIVEPSELLVDEYDRESRRFIVRLLDGKDRTGNAVFTNRERTRSGTGLNLSPLIEDSERDNDLSPSSFPRGR